MIYSRNMNSYIPVNIEKKVFSIPNYPDVTRYDIKDGRIPVGRVSLSDLPNGVFVEFIENFNPNLYKGLTETAYQIQVEHCLERGLNNFGILSYAALNSHAIHYLKGKRFIPSEINQKVVDIIKSTPKGEMYNTKFLGKIKMYMPKELIEKYIKQIKKFPLLKAKII